MTTQTKEQQAVALAKKHGAYVGINAASEKPMLVQINPRELTAMLADHAQQVREARTAELVANAAVMPEVIKGGKYGRCCAEEVREAIASLQAQLEDAKKAYEQHLGGLTAALDSQTNETNSALARVAELERVLVKAREDINWMVNTRQFLNPFVFDYIDAAMKKGGGV